MLSSNLYKGLITMVVIFAASQYVFNIISIKNLKNVSTVNKRSLLLSILSKQNLSQVKIDQTNTSTVAWLFKLLTEHDAASLHSNTTDLPLCPELDPSTLTTVKVIKTDPPSLMELERQFLWLMPGGHWKPKHCQVTKKVALIIPYRCRAEHLPLFLQHMHPFLKKQQIDYTLYIVEQEEGRIFNKGALMNVGYKEALKIDNYDCFIFHDIDLLPEDERNLYTCPEQPRHMSVAVDVFNYKLPYPAIFGGVTAITRDQFKLLNGFSNLFLGWGGEDNDMFNRIKYHNLHVTRYPILIGRYTMLFHRKEKANPHRYETLKKNKKKYDTDGLSNLQYTYILKKTPLYTWLLVDVGPHIKL